MRNPSTLIGLIAVMLLGFACPVAASPTASPSLSIIMPRGVQRGAQHELTFQGARLDETLECLLYFDGVTVDGITQVDSNQVKVMVTVAEDCRLGEHVAQLRTAYGITEYRSFFVGPYAAVAEVEPNNDHETAQAVGFDQTVTGTLAPEDVDRFIVTATAGQRISVEVEAIRLGTIFVDPYLEVSGPDDTTLGWQDDSFLTKQDCHVSFTAPADGDYRILLRDAAYGGNPNAHYRLHVGHFPRPTLVFPAGAKPGETVTVEFVDVAGGPVSQEIVVPAEPPRRDWLVMTDEQGVSPSPLPFRVVDLQNHFDAEPNQNIDQTLAIAVPGAVNGRLDEAGDQDWFSFEAKKDQVFDIDVFARRIGSPVDPLVHIWGPDKKYMAGNDDNNGPDSYMRFTAPADGTYYVRVRDHLERGGEAFLYRVEFSPVQAALTVTIPRIDRYSQTRQTVFVPQGNRFATLIRASRANFGGDLKLLGDQLPPGVTMHFQPMPGNLTEMPVVFEAAPDAALGGGLYDFLAAHVDDTTGIRGGFVNNGSFVLGEPNNTDYIVCSVDRLPMAVIKPLPFRLEIVQPQAPIVREGHMDLKIIAHRDEGFTAPINVEFPFRPPGIGAAGRVTIPEGQTEVTYPLDANGNAQIGIWPIYALGSADVGGAAYAASQLATLEIAQPFVTVELQRAGCEQGQETQFVGTLNQITEFEGQATAELLGIPPHTEIAPIQFDKTTSEIAFSVKTKPETPPGKHGGVFCRVTIPINGEPVVATAGRSELQVDKPLPTEQAAAPPPPPPTEKPLSRLEKLREAARLAKEQEGSNQ